jgi:hypothetical protein
MSFLISTSQSASSLTPWHEVMKLAMACKGDTDVIHLQLQPWPIRQETSAGEGRKEKEHLEGKGKWTREEQRAYIKFIR